ncbi:coiled-coil domain-containing protein 86 [Anthonomus grandis grandis]|uniref:coiled-coil domain-containing protein 86 n=1 Tax=Anthonomus grandis grandis TaxID=2921223 RepID=UPI002166A0CB|nr:coiled-coil domain-containing protein 86 [Anthonomus grandis grandis]
MTKETGNQKVVRMEDILKNSSESKSEEKAKKTDKKSKSIEPTIVKGKPKSGRFWKSEKKKFSSTIKTRGLKSSLEKKQALREKLQKIKETTRERLAQKKQEEEQRKERRRENLRRQEENRKKSEIVQVITNTQKLKKMKRKQLRYIEKRDTTIVSK